METEGLVIAQNAEEVPTEGRAEMPEGLTPSDFCDSLKGGNLGTEVGAEKSVDGLLATSSEQATAELEDASKPVNNPKGFIREGGQRNSNQKEGRDNRENKGSSSGQSHYQGQGGRPAPNKGANRHSSTRSEGEGRLHKAHGAVGQQHYQQESKVLVYLRGEIKGLYVDINKKLLSSDLLYVHAQKLARFLAHGRGIERNRSVHLRRFYDELLRLQGLLQRNEADWSVVRPLVKMLVAKAVYASARGLVDRGFVDFITWGCGEQVHNKEDLEVLLMLFESVLCFYKAS